MGEKNSENSIPLFMSPDYRAQEQTLVKNYDIEQYMRELPRRAAAMLCLHLEEQNGLDGIVAKIIEKFPGTPDSRINTLILSFQQFEQPEKEAKLFGGRLPAFWKIFPKNRETGQFPITQIHFGIPTVNFVKSNTVLHTFVPRIQKQLESQLIFTPAAILSCPFEILDYYNKPKDEIPLTGMIFHPIFVSITKRLNQQLNLMVYAINKRVWDEQAGELLDLSKIELQFNRDLAYVFEQLHRAQPFKGGSPE